MGVTAGSSGNYTFLWSTGESSSLTITDLPNGIYALEVTDGNGCEVKKAEQIQTNGITITDNLTDPTCVGATNGSAQIVSITGLQGNKQYLWSNGQNGTIATNLGAGTHFVTIQDETQCQIVHIVELVDPAAVEAEATVDEARLWRVKWYNQHDSNWWYRYVQLFMG